MDEENWGHRFREFMLARAEEKFQQEKNRRINQMLNQINRQKIIEDRLGEFMRGGGYPSYAVAEIKDLAKYICIALFPNARASGDLSEIRAALGLPEDIPEPLVGLIWRLQQRIEDLEEMIRGHYPLAGLSLRDLDEPKELPQLCGETLGNFACGEIKGHKGHHTGTRVTDNRLSWPQQ